MRSAVAGRPAGRDGLVDFTCGGKRFHGDERGAVGLGHEEGRRDGPRY